MLTKLTRFLRSRLRLHRHAQISPVDALGDEHDSAAKEMHKREKKGN